MMKVYPLTIENMKFYDHSMVGVYPIGDKIAYIHFAYGSILQEECEKEELTSSYALIDVFEADFSKRTQSNLAYNEQETFAVSDTVCYVEDNRFFLNTKRYIGFRNSIAKIIEVCDTKLVEVQTSPSPIPQIYNDSKIYTFGAFDIYMYSRFIMECRCHISKKVLWKLKLVAYLYTEVEEHNSILYFGTAGKGGRFYAVSIADGNLVFSYNTGGTVSFIWNEEYILLADRKSKPVLLSHKDGIEIQKINLDKFKLTIDQHMIVKNNRLYAVANNNDILYAVCVDL